MQVVKNLRAMNKCIGRILLSSSSVPLIMVYTHLAQCFNCYCNDQEDICNSNDEECIDNVTRTNILRRQDSFLSLTNTGFILLRYILTSRNQTPAGYIILDDLNKSYMNPCILDIKLGTRTYCIITSCVLHLGEGAPPEKVERHIRMCKKTTSGSLGIRVCGMRVGWCFTQN